MNSYIFNGSAAENPKSQKLDILKLGALYAVCVENKNREKM
jgi:hypothetical protein